MNTQNLRHALMIGAGMICTTAGAAEVSGTMVSGTAVSGTADEASASATAADAAGSEQIVVQGRYLTQRIDSTPIDLDLLDLPRNVNVIEDDLLQEQGHVTLQDSLRNVPGITLEAGEGNPPGGGDAITIRGFSARDDVFVDGLRDVGLYFRDPYNVSTIEVSKGPGSAILGHGNVGGSLNLVSRKPELANRIGFEASVGTDDFFRATTDLNGVISEAGGIAFRLNAMAHTSDKPGREIVTRERWSIAPSISAGLGTDTVVTLDYFHLEQDDLPDGGIPNARDASLAGTPFAGRVAPVPRDSFYGHTNDIQDVRADRVTLSADHFFSDNVRLDFKVRYGEAEIDLTRSSPRFVGTVTTLDETTQARGDQKPRLQTEEILIGRANLYVDADLGGTSHSLVFGVEASTEESRNIRRLDTRGPSTPLFNPVERTIVTNPFNGTSAETQTDILAFYAFDTIEFSPQFFLSGGVRFDTVTTSVQSFDESGSFPGFVVDLERKDDEFSGNLGLTFKPTPNTALFAAWGTSFEPNARSEVVQLAGGNNNPPVRPEQFDTAPERTEAFEIGGKWQSVDGRLLGTLSLFQIEKTNARTPGNDPGDPAIVLEGEQRVRGIEANLTGELTEWMSVFAGYTYLDGEVTRSNNPLELGQPLALTPEHSFSIWTSFDVTDRFRFGGGVQYKDSVTSQVFERPDRLTTTVDAYTLVDLFAEYQATDNFTVRANLDNAFDEFYFPAVQSAQSIPGDARAFRLSLIGRF